MRSSSWVRRRCVERCLLLPSLSFSLFSVPFSSLPCCRARPWQRRRPWAPWMPPRRRRRRARRRLAQQEQKRLKKSTTSSSPMFAMARSASPSPAAPGALSLKPAAPPPLAAVPPSEKRAAPVGGDAGVASTTAVGTMRRGGILVLNRMEKKVKRRKKPHLHFSLERATRRPTLVCSTSRSSPRSSPL